MYMQDRPIEELKNFGPYMVDIMHRIGVYTEKDLLDSSYSDIADRLLEHGIRPHLLIFYSIAMGLQDKPWTAIPVEEKTLIRAQLSRVRV